MSPSFTYLTVWFIYPFGAFGILNGLGTPLSFSYHRSINKMNRNPQHRCYSFPAIQDH